MEVVEDASKDSTKGCSTDIQQEVVCHHVTGVYGVPPGLERSNANGQGGVEGCTSEVVDGAESPEDETDGWQDPD